MEQQLRDSTQTSTNLETVIAIGGTDGNKASLEFVEASSSCSRVCRVCHLSAKESANTALDFIDLGCRCKGELGLAHSQCAEAWFRVKGNRLCEICGEAATNVTGAGDSSFVEEWNERRWSDGSNAISDGSRRCLQGQPLCNFLMGCLVIAFILPWFFHLSFF